ncbi:hypothetical protein CDD83_9652 [Cordyceps sp. RAO-2017]|nr:hypothetical protein CDD83_9652 [Cordyceps sp. RAO-2017]
MPVKSLMELAAMACIKNIKSLESVGDFLPYDQVRPILLKVDNACQMRQIELNSPQLQGETGEIWIKIIEKDFPLEYKATAYKPQSADKWYRVWEKYKKEHDKALEESERKLMDALAGLKQDKEKNTSKIVERKFLPRAGRVGPKRGFGPRDHTASALTFNMGSRTKTHTGASVMRKVRREVKEIATIHGALSKPIRGPTRHGEVKKAPEAMVGEHRRAAQPQFRSSAQAPESVSVVEQYEKRATFISDSDEDDDGLSDEAAQKPHTRPTAVPAAKAAPSAARSAVSEAARVSLLKKKPAALRGSPTPRPVAKAQSNTPAKQGNTTATSKLEGSTTSPSKKQGNTATPPRGAASLANKFGRNGSKPAATAYQSSPEPTVPSSKAAPEGDEEGGLPVSRTTPPLGDSSGPSSADEIVSSLANAAPQPQPRKRKAIDIFMRPKRRKP